ncbi:alkene reductase [Motiliproteus sp. MSK22-1]|uniref:alkene reductase n=1 Tax=Motiliproteus sp. MSK22-1 TaxID=1897630 RepID=UPI0009757731|nr:alkene reductase [Motiliproteus sp. MSK22-1]OMH38929.1 alkene reductase [Motiliproteus sp. MSK22-1]
MELFKALNMNSLELNNRVVLAPMTRSRTQQPGDVPTELNATYYAQRATAGLQITEATQISEQGKGYALTPGIHSADQIKGWQKVTKAVHQHEGKIFLQLWHVGRVSHPSLQQDNQQPVAPSAIKPSGTQVYIIDQFGKPEFIDCETPRALETDEIDGVIQDFVRAAENAISAGFDGVEIHGANGYLIDQFLRTNSNIRTDQYGGSIENRVRFLTEVSTAVANKIGPHRVGVRLSPYVTFKDMACPEIIPTILLAAKQLNALDIAYLHLSEADWDDAPTIPDSFRKQFREAFSGAIIVAGRYDRERAENILKQGYADLVAFGRPFVANPDLPNRLKHQLPLADFNPETLFGGGKEGYTDYLPMNHE